MVEFNNPEAGALKFGGGLHGVHDMEKCREALTQPLEERLLPLRGAVVIRGLRRVAEQIDDFITEAVGWGWKERDRLTILVAAQGIPPDRTQVLRVPIFRMERVNVSCDEFLNAFANEARAATGVFNKFLVAESQVLSPPTSWN